MKVYAISDLHLSGSCDKPMDIFGGEWKDYVEKIAADWRARVGEGDVVLLPGDLSWAMNLEQAKTDFEFLAELPGSKVIIRGNHDYWWNSLSKLRSALPSGIYPVQNDVLRLGNLLVCGTRGWTVPESGKTLSAEDKKIYLREVERMKLTLSAMAKERKDGDAVAVMTHYPPFNSRRESNELTELIESAKPDFAVYGHLHGKDSRADLVVSRGGVDYYLTSCDLLKNTLLQLPLSAERD